MTHIHRLRIQGLALIGACGLVFLGMGCRETQTPIAVPTPTPADQSIETKRFFLESPGILERAILPQICPTKDATEPIVLLGHYPPASTHFGVTLERWKACTNRTVRHLVILSPDHYQRLGSGFATTNLSYRVREKYFSANQLFTSRLHDIGAVSSTLFPEEHGVGVPVAIASRRFDALESVTAIAVSRKISEEDARALTRELQLIIDQPDALLLVSVDFSHGLSRDQARIMDRETRQALFTRDRAFFWRAQDTHVDFGRGVSIVLGLLSEQGRVYIDQSFDGNDLRGTDQRVTTFMSGWLTGD